MAKFLDKLVARYIDKNKRSPRGFGFSIDAGIADRGSRYGGAQTIHNTGTIDIVIENNTVTEVWFRCRQLPFRVSSPKGSTVYEFDQASPIVAIEFDERENFNA